MFNILKEDLFSDSVVTMILQDQQQLIQSLIRCQKKFTVKKWFPVLGMQSRFLDLLG